MKKNKIIDKKARKIFMKENPYLYGLLCEMNRKLDLLIKREKEWIKAFDKRHQ